MELVLLGTGAAWPDSERNAPSLLLKHKDKKILIDCGGGVCHQLMRAGVAPSELDTIFFSHIHIDHCVEFPSLVFGAYLTGKEGSFNLFGPSGIEHFANSIFNDTYDFARPMMKKLRNKDIDIRTKELGEGQFYNEDGLIAEAAPVEHGIPTLAYKFTANGKTIVLSGDTQPCESLINISKKADLLAIECSFPEHIGPKPGHLIPSQVGEIAEQASVKKVVLLHLFPNCRGHEDEMINDVKKRFKGPVQIGEDLQTISV
ncbi:MAG: MBL fold metallo-hydrolase [Thermoleophilia bacterium]